MNISINNLLMKYEDKVVLDIENIYCDKGKIYGILGPNGCGKTTMMKIIAGLKQSTLGTILYEEKEMNEKISKFITYTKQSPYMLKTTVLKNIAYPLKVRGYKKNEIDRMVNGIMNEFKIQNLANQKATSLSGGEAQKTALARALIFNPQLILLDEPTANIDPEAIELIESALVKRNKENNMTVLIVTHSISQAKRICDNIMVFNNGKIIEYGETKDLIINPKKAFTKKFLSL